VIAKRLSGERGSALVAAMLVMSTILALGLAMMSQVDGQSRQSGSERGRESTFNWAESVLNAQTFTVANYWPAASDKRVMDCSWSGAGAPTASNGDVNACPDPTVISNSFTGNVDVKRGGTWSTKVRDDLGSSQCEDSPAKNCSYTWDDATSLTNPNWDSNGDDMIWLRAEGTVNKDRRVVVALVRIQNDPLNLPQSVIVAGSLGVKGGNKTFVSQNGSSISLRCQPLTDSDCYSEQKPGVNVQGPGSKQAGYDDGGHVMTADELDAMRTKARSIQRYYPTGTCPSSAAGFSGAVVFIENMAQCPINHGWQINPPPSPPGILIVNQGTIRFNGNADFWGLIYMVNNQGFGPSDPALFDGIGNGNLHGALFVDGNGRVDNQGSFTLDYDATPLNNLTTFGATGIVPNSFREIRP
jgi:Tfp pilus assembly protein PilX